MAFASGCAAPIARVIGTGRNRYWAFVSLADGNSPESVFRGDCGGLSRPGDSLA